MLKVGGYISQIQLNRFIEELTRQLKVNLYCSKSSETNHVEDTLTEFTNYLNSQQMRIAIASIETNKQEPDLQTIYNYRVCLIDPAKPDLRQAKPHSANKLIQKIKQLVASHLEAGLTLTYHDIADICGISERSLQRQLKEQGYNYRMILGEVRHQLACELLVSTDSTLKAIAFHLGYSCHHAFTRAFKNIETITPSEYRYITQGNK